MKEGCIIIGKMLVCTFICSPHMFRFSDFLILKSSNLYQTVRILTKNAIASLKIFQVFNSF